MKNLTLSVDTRLIEAGVDHVVETEITLADLDEDLTAVAEAGVEIDVIATQIATGTAIGTEIDVIEIMIDREGTLAGKIDQDRRRRDDRYPEEEDYRDRKEREYAMEKNRPKKEEKPEKAPQPAINANILSTQRLIDFSFL
jgi:hypothetical protein